jgi:hypothetical protein
MGTGFMKCMPSTRSGRPVSPASRVMEIADVLAANTTSGRQMPSRRGYTSFFSSHFSVMFSMTKSASAS